MQQKHRKDKRKRWESSEHLNRSKHDDLSNTSSSKGCADVALVRQGWALAFVSKILEFEVSSTSSNTTTETTLHQPTNYKQMRNYNLSRGMKRADENRQQQCTNMNNYYYEVARKSGTL